MRERLALLLCSFLLLFPITVICSDINMDQLHELTARFPFAITVNENDPAHMKFLYADLQQHVHLYHIQKGKLVLEWETTNLGSRVVALIVKDLFADGKAELIIATEGGRILIYSMDDYDLLWENLQDPFKKIECMSAANIDSDPQSELLFVADSYLYIYDSKNHTMEWQSQKNFEARQILIANVDDDEQPEIILNTGFIVDSRFYSTEFELDKSFGERISLFDLNGDGIPEIFGEFSNYSIKVYDIYAERELW